MSAERLLLGPGPSPVAPRVMQALRRPVLSHLDPDMMILLGELSAKLDRLFGAGADAFSLAVSGTGSAGLEAAVANTARPGTRVAAIANGYFGERLAHVFELYGAAVTRIDAEWGRACDPDALRRVLQTQPFDIVAVVHAETSTGVMNPLPELLQLAVDHGALTVVDAVTSLAAIPLRAHDWKIDVCYSCTQKGLGAPSGLAPITFSSQARQRRSRSRSFYLDLELLEAYWRQRKYHHTISAPLIYALDEALNIVEEEGLDARWARHERTHRALAAGIESLGLELLPPAAERLWTLNAICVPPGLDESAIRGRLLERFGIEIGAGLGPLAGRIWRVGLMGSGSTLANVLAFLEAFERVLGEAGYRVATKGTALAAAESAAN